MTNIGNSNHLMDEERYWLIIAESLADGEHQPWQEHFLIHRLKNLTPDDIIGFHLRTEALLLEAYTSDLWCAAFIMNRGCSDDGFEYFRCWLISRGKKAYYVALNNPDSLVSYIDPTKRFYDFERFGYIPSYVFEQKTGENLYDYIKEDLKQDGINRVIQFTWNSSHPETLQVICPYLFNRMWDK